MRLQILPHDSALVVKDNKGPRWQVGDYLLADVFQALTGKQHPARPQPPQRKEHTARRARAERAVARRFAQRNRTLAASTRAIEGPQ